MRARGFTLIELMIVVAIIAVIAAIAIPGLLRSRISTNESSAIGSVRMLATGETQFHEASVVDCDGDGAGEYGFLSELSGLAGARIDGGVGTTKCNPSCIPQSLGVVQNGMAEKAGYKFRVYLPVATGGTAIFEVSTPPNGVKADADSQEVRWCCYAWPVAFGQSGRRCYVICEANELIGSTNITQAYDGSTNIPAPGAAYDVGGIAPQNLEGGIARTNAVTAVDGGTWRPN